MIGSDLRGGFQKRESHLSFIVIPESYAEIMVQIWVFRILRMLFTVLSKVFP